MTLPLPRWILALAVVLGVLAFLALPALAEDGSIVPGVDPAPSSFGVFDALWGLAAVLATNVVTLLAQSFAPATFAPEPSTARSRRLTLCVAIGAGLFWGLVGLAPVTPVDLPVPLAANLVGRLVSGLIVAGIAVYGRKGVVRGIYRPAKARRAARSATPTA